MRSDSTSEVESMGQSVFALPYRGHRGHSHSRNTATSGSRPLLFQYGVAGSDIPAGSNISLTGNKHIPNIVIIEGLHVATGAVYRTLLEVI